MYQEKTWLLKHGWKSRKIYRANFFLCGVKIYAKWKIRVMYELARDLLYLFM